MSLRCLFTKCSSLELANESQLAFYQDINSGGWNLGLGPEFNVSRSALPTNIRLIDTGDDRFPYTVICGRCDAHLGKVGTVCGFDHHSVNFSAKKVSLLESKYSVSSSTGASKWSKVITNFPRIRKLTATIRQNASLIGSDTVHYHGLSEFQDMVNAATVVASRSDLTPRRYQYRAYFFSCLNNTLLCLPTGMGKTLIANMLMKAYHQRNPNKGQVFIVPTVVLVDQQALVIEKTTGLKAQRRSGDHKELKQWSPSDIVVCTPAILNNAIKMKLLDLSQLSLLVLDEVHEGNAPNSQYGFVLSYIDKCSPAQRPRVLGLTASPLNSAPDMRESILHLCGKLIAKPFMPLLDDDKNTDQANDTSCNFISICKSPFEEAYEKFVIECVETLSSLHDYFKSNWKEIHVNVPTKQKVDAIVKILSRATKVGQNDTDMKLLQLSQWMSKWIDSLDMLQIFGPRQLIKYIREDLDFVWINDYLTHILAQVQPILNVIKTKLDRLEMQHNIAQDSPRVTELLAQLRKHQGEKQRILVFVERRATAERLSRRLKDDPEVEKMNPDYVVGSSDSGFTKEMQQTILANFREGKCKVLICTSVLEQGIDVTACGVVICYDGVKSLKSIIQTRGRARMKKAVFLAFVDETKHRKANELTQSEVAMNYVLLQLMREQQSAFDSQFEHEIDKFLDSGGADMGTPDDEDFVNDDEEEEEYWPHVDENQIMISLRFFNFIDSDALATHIHKFFKSPSDRLRVQRKFITARFAVLDEGDDGTQIIKKISSAFDEKLSSKCCSWVEILNTSDTDLTPAWKNFSVEFDYLTAFHFENYVKVNLDMNSIWFQPFKMTILTTEILLETDLDRFSIRAIDVEGPIMINDTDKCLEIYLCLRSPPQFFHEDSRMHYDFEKRSFNLYMHKTSPIDPSHMTILRNALKYFSMQVYNVCHLKERSFERYDDDLLMNEFFQDYTIKVWQSQHAAVLPPKLPENVVQRFRECATKIDLEVLLNNTVPVRFQPIHIQKPQRIELPFKDCGPPKNYEMFGRVKVTPSRFIFMPMTAVQLNRVFRFFPNPEDFLLVSFTDEYDGNPWKMENVYIWYLSVLQNGIKIGGKNFTFLGCSNSQLREGRCWFSSLDRQMVYDKIGDFDPDWTAGRKLTRLGLAFASSVDTIPLDHELYLRCVNPDVGTSQICFSDGIGRASLSVFKKIKDLLKIYTHVSAFQIRVGGIKGVISVFDGSNEDIHIRKSMKKFESSHNILEVLNYSRSMRLSLNRHIVLILSSFGVPNEVFLQLQFDELMKCMDALTEDDKALTFVKSRAKTFRWEMFPDKRVVQEPFFRQILFSNTSELVSEIANHAHVTVNEGRILMGVLDETFTLNYGEVYAQIVEDGEAFELEGTVVVFRNPSVLPSDIRILTAKRNVSPRLKSLYQNCLVIPAQGQASHAHECSGGDLDGDLYYIIWDQRLIPPNLTAPGRKVIEVETEEIVSASKGHSDEEMMRFFCDFAAKNQLGIIANAHLATADKLGIEHPRSIELARYVVAETDAPRKGFTVGRISSKLLPDEYPDYMNKPDKKSYRSTTVLGDMYRQAYPILDVLLEKRIIAPPQSRMTLNIKKESVENYYMLYSYEVRKLLQGFELESEVDLFSGTPMWKKGYMSTFKHQFQLRETLQDTVNEFWNKWRNTFTTWRKAVEDQQSEINEWYRRPRSCVKPIHSFSWLAMPYINFDEFEQKSVSDQIQTSTIRWIVHNKIDWLDAWRKRFNVGEAVMKKLEGINCHFYGSSVLGLSEDYSDVDLYAGDKDFHSLKMKLLTIDKFAVDMKKPHTCVSLTKDDLPIDVTNFAGGVYKTHALAETFDENPAFWPALRVLVQWARIVRLVKSGGSEGLMTVVSFCHMFIYFATQKQPKTISIIAKPYSFARFKKLVDSSTNEQCGSLIFDFLKMISNRQNKTKISYMKDPISGENLIKSDLIEELCKLAEVAIYILAVHEGNVQKLFQFTTKSRLFRIDKRFMNPLEISDANKKHCMQEILRKCNPQKCENLQFELLKRNGLFYLEVSGDHKYFPMVERGISKIHNRIHCARISNLRKINTYHIKDSTIVMPEFGWGKNTKVSFSPYGGDNYHAQHTGMAKSILTTRNNEKNLNWRVSEYQRYFEAFMRQINSFKQKKFNIGTGSKLSRFVGELQCSIRIGINYMFHVPETLHNTFESITMGQIERCIAKFEEGLGMEKQEDIIRELRNYNSHQLIKPEPTQRSSNAPLSVMPLQEVKLNAKKNKNQEISSSVRKNVAGMSHSFYTMCSQSTEKIHNFAMTNGFQQLPISDSDHYFTISIYWRQRELVITTDKEGMIVDIRHRRTRWVSATFKRYDTDGGEDVRAYLENRALLDDDESCLNTIIEYLDGLSLFEDDFKKQIQVKDFGDGTTASLSTRPLVPGMFNLNFRYRSMRRIIPVLKYENAEHDVMLYQEINDGIFQTETSSFEWYPKHHELEVRMNMNRPDSKLCEDSFKMSLTLFDLSKK